MAHPNVTVAINATAHGANTYDAMNEWAETHLIPALNEALGEERRRRTVPELRAEVRPATRYERLRLWLRKVMRR